MPTKKKETKKTTAKKTSEGVVASERVREAAPVLVGAGVASKTAVNGNGSKPRPQAKSQQRKTPRSPSRFEGQPATKPKAKAKTKPKAKAKPKSLSLPLEPKTKTRAVPPSVMKKAAGQAKHHRKVGKRKAKAATLIQGWLFLFGLIFGAVALGYVATKIFLNPTPKTAAKAQLAIAISQPNIELPPVEAKPVVAKPKLTLTQQSQQVIDRWLKSKSAAFGKEHQIERLNGILAEPLLTTWRDRAASYQEGDFYREYQHQIKMRSAKLNPQNPQKATVEAEVREKAQHYQSGQLDKTQSYDDNLLVRYQLVRQGETWLIKNSEVLKTL